MALAEEGLLGICRFPHLLLREAAFPPLPSDSGTSLRNTDFYAALYRATANVSLKIPFDRLHYLRRASRSE